MKLSPLILYMGVMVLLLPSVSASHNISPTEALIIAQVTNPTTACTGVVNPPDPSYGNQAGFPALISGHTYLLFIANAGDTIGSIGPRLKANGSSMTVQVFRDGTVVPGVGTSIHLINHTNITGSGKNFAFAAVVRFTAASTGTYEIDGSDYFMYDYTFSGTSGRAGNFDVKSTNPSRCADPNAVRVASTIFDTGNATFPPSTPTLTGVVDGVWNDLAWSVSVGASGGYNLTRCDAWALCTTFPLGPSTFAYRDGGDTTNRSYTVKGWSLTAGNGSVSNTVTLKIASHGLFADTSPLYGGGKSALATGLNISGPATGFLIGSLLVMLLVAGGWWAIGAPGAIMGAVAGVFTAMAVGMWPIWTVFLLLAIGAAAFFMARQKGET